MSLAHCAVDGLALYLRCIDISPATAAQTTATGMQDRMTLQGTTSRDKVLSRVTYQKLRKLAAISRSVSSSRVRLRLVPREWPEPSLEMDKLAPEVPLRCTTGREDLDLKA